MSISQMWRTPEHLPNNAPHVRNLQPLPVAAIEPRTSGSNPHAKSTEHRILATGRGRIVTDVSRGDFEESFLSRLKQGVEPSTSHAPYFQIAASQEWGEKQFYEDVLKPSVENMCAASIPLFMPLVASAK